MAALDHVCSLHRGEATVGRRSNLATLGTPAQRHNPRHCSHACSQRVFACQAQHAQSAQPAPKQQEQRGDAAVSRRALGALTASVAAAAVLRDPSPAHADTPFVTTASGLRIQDIRCGAN